jgi:hypothetical protein
MSEIYLSYRRMETAAYAGRLFDHLSRHFGPGSVFMDIGGISRGQEFARAIESALNECKVVLVLVGSSWVTCTDGNGQRRLDDPNDWVRVETVAALRRNVLVVPVLVGGARLPDPASLPEDLRPLCQRHACELTDMRWLFDVGELIKDLQRVVRPRKRLKVPDAKREPMPWMTWLIIASVLSISIGYCAMQKATPVHNGTSSDTVKPSPVTRSSVAPVVNPVPGEKQSVTLSPEVAVKGKRVNLLSKENGQVVVASSSTWADIIDGDEYAYAGLLPDDFAIFEFKNERPANFDLFTTLITRTDRENVKEFELWQGNESPNGSFQLIGTFQTQNVKLFKTPDQEFRFLPVTAKYLKIKIVSAWDHSSGVHLHRVQLFGIFQ